MVGGCCLLVNFIAMVVILAALYWSLSSLSIWLLLRQGPTLILSTPFFPWPTQVLCPLSTTCHMSKWSIGSEGCGAILGKSRVAHGHPGCLVYQLKNRFWNLVIGHHHCKLLTNTRRSEAQKISAPTVFISVLWLSENWIYVFSFSEIGHEAAS